MVYVNGPGPVDFDPDPPSYDPASDCVRCHRVTTTGGTAAILRDGRLLCSDCAWELLEREVLTRQLAASATR